MAGAESNLRVPEQAIAEASSLLESYKKKLELRVRNGDFFGLGSPSGDIVDFVGAYRLLENELTRVQDILDEVSPSKRSKLDTQLRKLIQNLSDESLRLVREAVTYSKLRFPKLWSEPSLHGKLGKPQTTPVNEIKSGVVLLNNEISSISSQIRTTTGRLSSSFHLGLKTWPKQINEQISALADVNRKLMSLFLEFHSQGSQRERKKEEKGRPNSQENNEEKENAKVKQFYDEFLLELNEYKPENNEELQRDGAFAEKHLIALYSSLGRAVVGMQSISANSDRFREYQLLLNAYLQVKEINNLLFTENFYYQAEEFVYKILDYQIKEVIGALVREVRCSMSRISVGEAQKILEASTLNELTDMLRVLGFSRHNKAEGLGFLGAQRIHGVIESFCYFSLGESKLEDFRRFDDDLRGEVADSVLFSYIQPELREQFLTKLVGFLEIERDETRPYKVEGWITDQLVHSNKMGRVLSMNLLEKLLSKIPKSGEADAKRILEFMKQRIAIDKLPGKEEWEGVVADNFLLTHLLNTCMKSSVST